MGHVELTGPQPCKTCWLSQKLPRHINWQVLCVCVWIESQWEANLTHATFT